MRYMSAGISNKDAEARRLAEAHYAVETGITHIFRITGSPDAEGRSDEPIKLLEVNEHTVPSGVIVPLHFRPAPSIGVVSSSTIVEVTPQEFAKIRSHELVLPDGWTIGDLIPRKTATNGSGRE